MWCWWRECGRLALDDEGYLWLLGAGTERDRRLGHVEDDPRLPDDLAVELEPVKAWLAAERRAEPTRQDEVREWRGHYEDGLR